MFKYMMSNPTELVKYIVLIVLFIVVLIIYRKTKTGDGRVFGNTKAENMLKREYSVINEETFSPDKDNYRLIVGMCMRIQTSLEKEKSPNDAFLAMDEVKRNVMTLGYLFEDSQVALSNFFRSNGEPLLSAADKAVKDVIGGEIAEIVTSAFNMFDENNEDVSVDENEVKRLDEKYRKIMDSDKQKIYTEAANYIRYNKNLFM